MALLTENGPCRINDDLSTEHNPHAWNSQANMLWLDQPSNTGFSYAVKEDADRDELDVGDNFYSSLKSVKTELNVPPTQSWRESNASVSMPFEASGDVLQNHAPLVADLLNHTDLRVLLYAGDADSMCTWYGIRAWVTELDWVHKDAFNAAGDRPFILTNDSQALGSAWSYENQLTFVRLFDTGHMAPRDQPSMTLAMFELFLRGDTF